MQLIPKSALALFYKIKGNHLDAHNFAYYLEYLTFHLPEGKLVPALEWLIKNKLTEDRFIEFVQGECKNSGLELIRLITMRLEKDKKPRKLYAPDLAVAH